MRRLTVSVIIPALNEEARIGTLLENLREVPAAEVIVSDGGSADRTREICSRFPVTVVNSARGRGRQLNAGAAAATGDILFFLHADSSVEPRVPDDLRAAVAGGRRWGCCTLAFDDRTLFFRAVAAASNWRARALSSCYGDQGIFCERELFRESGGFADVPLMEDVEFSRRLRRRERACVVPGRVTTSARRFKAGGPVRTILRMQALKALYAGGVRPERLAGWYRSTGGEG